VTTHFKGSDEKSPFLFDYSRYVAKASFNKPKALNALDHEVLLLLKEEVQKWSSNPIKAVIFTGNGGKAFCIGSELKQQYIAKKEENLEFLDSHIVDLYTLYYKLAIMKPIQITLWDGLVMGAGFGVSSNAPIKIATEYAGFSMPEARIGHFLGSACGYHFSRMRSHLGYFLGLTGYMLKGKELVQCGVADFYIKREKLPIVLEDNF